MDESTNKIKSTKDRIEPYVWLVGSVLVPVIVALVTAWKTIISPAIVKFEENLTSKIQTQINDQISSFRQLTIDHETALGVQLDIIKHKISDELDSTYYFTRSYSTVKNPSVDQEPLSQFFYTADKDVVLLFIWSSGATATMKISINGGPPKALEDFGAHSWTNVDITNLVKGSNPLNEEMYPGIGENVYYISIKPIPKKIPPRIGTASMSHQLARNTTSDSRQKEELGNDVDVYALLIVRRSPFK